MCHRAVSGIPSDGDRVGRGASFVARIYYYDEEYSVIYAGGLPYYLSWQFVSSRLTQFNMCSAQLQCLSTNKSDSHPTMAVNETNAITVATKVLSWRLNGRL